MTFSNKLSAAEAERLAILAEELGEATQAIGKILRHGYESYNPDDINSMSNRGQLQKELGDIFCAVDMMVSANDLNGKIVTHHREKKAEKIKPYLHHQELSDES